MCKNCYTCKHSEKIGWIDKCDQVDENTFEANIYKSTEDLEIDLNCDGWEDDRN